MLLFEIIFLLILVLNISAMGLGERFHNDEEVFKNLCENLMDALTIIDNADNLTDK